MDSSNEIVLNTEKLRSGINKLASAVLITMGPEGRTVIITDEDKNPYITKDGVSVAKAIDLKDPVEASAVKLIKQVAEKTVEDAGDGTTTSICLATALINIGSDLLAHGVPYTKIKRDLEEFLSITLDELGKNKKELKTEDIVNIAKISANNDNDIAEIIDRAFKHSSVVKVEEANSLTDELDKTSGMKLLTTYFSKAFINNQSSQAAIYKDALVLLVDGKLERLDMIVPLLNELNGKPMLIFADSYSEVVISLLKENYNKGMLNIVPVKAPGIGQHRKDLMSDIAIYTEADEYTSPMMRGKSMKETVGLKLGKISYARVGKNGTLISNVHSNKACQERIEELREALDSEDVAYDKDLLKQRIENLTGKLSTIKVGGKSEVEIKERKDRIDDAVLAVESALQEGIVEGGGVALYRIYDSSALSHNSFCPALSAPMNRINFNGANVSHKDNMFEKEIIDPHKVTRCALENAVSVAKTILSTGAIVLDESQWN